MNLFFALSIGRYMDGPGMMKQVGWAQVVIMLRGNASRGLDGVEGIDRIHLILGVTIFLVFPFTRLVHIWSAPVEYFTRRYQVMRARN
ncbi:respiratory nitrate reductase subunit gamma [Pantoea ananatis]|nr:respiratory nitrate reductase subunit gamma [Pantoea ananatis]OWY78900.1 respiratory nitrate reductase subunit gamma [Pantoea sp. AMG 501]PKC28490.1 nitrate reductase [Pantoea ananatis 15320]NCU08522.1 respiratory nitrate reductase subunit gamma [Pantoea ananatis]PQL02659.1 respiratory nitrate reductase subunit gamma [Pantoea ananatis]